MILERAGLQVGLYIPLDPITTLARMVRNGHRAIWRRDEAERSRSEVSDESVSGLSWSQSSVLTILQIRSAGSSPGFAFDQLGGVRRHEFLSSRIGSVWNQWTRSSGAGRTLGRSHPPIPVYARLLRRIVHEKTAGTGPVRWKRSGCRPGAARLAGRAGEAFAFDRKQGHALRNRGCKLEHLLIVFIDEGIGL